MWQSFDFYSEFVNQIITEFERNCFFFFRQIAQSVSLPAEDVTNFIELPVEILLLVFEDMDLKDLIAIAKSDPYIQRVAEMVYKAKFSKSPFEIDDYYQCTGQVAGDECVERLEFDSILDLFQVFGHLISKLVINHMSLREQPEKLRALNEHISKFMSHSLIEIKFSYLFNGCLVGLQEPFAKVECVTFGNTGSIEPVDHSNNMNLSAMFPVVRQISLYGSSPFNNPKMMEQHFPNLESMEFKSGMHEKSQPSILERRFQLNPQLRCLSFSKASWNVLEVISKNAPNIEHIQILEFNAAPDMGDNDIILENLKVFSVQNSLGDVARVPFVFGSLEELSFTMYERVMDLWVDVFIQNKQLKKLNTGYLTDDAFERMTDQLPHLEEFTMKFIRLPTNNSIATIHEFLQKANKLKCVTFLQANSDTSKALKTQLTTEWNLTEYHQKLIFTQS